METKPPLPPFTLETAKAKVQAAEDGWNGRNPEKVALAYTIDSEWRNRAENMNGMMTEAFGIVPTATKIGNLPTMA